MILKVTSPTKLVIFKRPVLFTPDKDLNHKFTVKTIGLSIEVMCQSMMVGKIQVVNIRIIVNECVTANVDFTVDFLIHNQGRSDRVLLSELFTQKTIKLIMQDL